MLKRFVQDKGGATAIEYGLICACIVVVLLGGLGAYRDAMETMLTDVNEKLRPPLS